MTNEQQTAREAQQEQHHPSSRSEDAFEQTSSPALDSTGGAVQHAQKERSDAATLWLIELFNQSRQQEQWIAETTARRLKEHESRLAEIQAAYESRLAEIQAVEADVIEAEVQVLSEEEGQPAVHPTQEEPGEEEEKHTVETEAQILPQEEARKAEHPVQEELGKKEDVQAVEANVPLSPEKSQPAEHPIQEEPGKKEAQPPSSEKTPPDAPRSHPTARSTDQEENQRPSQTNRPKRTANGRPPQTAQLQTQPRPQERAEGPAPTRSSHTPPKAGRNDQHPQRTTPEEPVNGHKASSSSRSAPHQVARPQSQRPKMPQTETPPTGTASPEPSVVHHAGKGAKGHSHRRPRPTGPQPARGRDEKQPQAKPAQDAQRAQNEGAHASRPLPEHHAESAPIQKRAPAPAKGGNTQFQQELWLQLLSYQEHLDALTREMEAREGKLAQMTTRRQQENETRLEEARAWLDVLDTTAPSTWIGDDFRFASVRLQRELFPAEAGLQRHLSLSAFLLAGASVLVWLLSQGQQVLLCVLGLLGLIVGFRFLLSQGASLRIQARQEYQTACTEARNTILAWEREVLNAHQAPEEQRLHTKIEGLQREISQTRLRRLDLQAKYDAVLLQQKEENRLSDE
jgi:hypothetical protein